jgi:hypothetical protein
MSSSDPRRRLPWSPSFEATVVFCLILAYIWRFRFTFNAGWALLLALVIASHLYRRETMAGLGFRWKGFERSFSDFFPFVLFLSLVLLALGMMLHTVRDITWDSAFFGLVSYCLWGLFQQYLLNGYFVNRFLEDRPKPAAGQVPILAATLFSAAHLPNLFLMLVTFAGGYLCAKAYLRSRNLYFLGIAHGIIGFLLYLVVPDSISQHLRVGPGWFAR